MLKIEVNSAEFVTKNGTSAKTGKPYSIREQEGWAYTCGRDGKPYPHPQKVSLTLDDDQNPYAVGTYVLDPSSIYIDRFGQMALRAKLKPLAAAASQYSTAKAA